MKEIVNLDQSFTLLHNHKATTFSLVNSDNAISKAMFLWVNEKNKSFISDKTINLIVKDLIENWTKPFPSVYSDNSDIYTSNLALIYSTLELVKENHNRPEIQKTLTEIKDYVFDNLLEKGKLISGKHTRVVTPDELLSVWPYDLFSAEDLVLVEAADDIKSRYYSFDIYWQALYIHYLISRSYFQEAENLYTEINFEDLPIGIKSLLISRMERHLKNKSKITFIHTENGNMNRYIPLKTQRQPLFPQEGEKIYIPVGINTDKKIGMVFLSVQSSNGYRTSKELTENKNIWSTTLELPVGNYQYYFTAKINNKSYSSKKYNLAVYQKKSVRRLILRNVDPNHLAFDLYDKDNIPCGTLTLRKNDNNLEFLFNKKIRKGSLEESQSKYELIKDSFNVRFDSTEEKLTIDVHNKRLFTQSSKKPAIQLLVDKENKLKKTYIQFEADSDEKYFGFGERYNQLNQAGNLVDNYVYNQYKNQGIKTYMPMPLYFSSKNYGLWVDTSLYCTFDLRETMKGLPEQIAIENNFDSPLSLKLFSGDSINEIVSKVATKTGRPEMLPVWAMGLWMSSNNWDRQSVVNEQLSLANKYKIPATVFVLEQWSDEATYYMFNDSAYKDYKPYESINYNRISFPDWGRWPNPKKMIDQIHNDGLKLILWQIPILKEYPLNKNKMLDADKKYAIENKLVVQHNNKPYYIPEGWFTNALVWDPTNKRARDWWFSKRQYLLDMGVDGFKTDGGECIFGTNLKFSNGLTERQMRNQYPKDYIGAYYQFLKQKNGIAFSRSGYTGAQQMPAHWAGDERSTFAAFNRELYAGINASLSGIIFWGWDFAGFNGDIPTAELYLRATESATFMPIMQYHAESKGQFNQDRTPWNIQKRTGDTSVIPIFKKYADLRMNLLPYIYDQSLKAVEECTPLMRALLLDFQDDARVNNIYDEFMFGKSLLVAPVVKEHQTKRKVYLPDGEWCDFWNHNIYEGKQEININVPIDKIPVFIKENSVLLLNTDNYKLMSYVSNDLKEYKDPLLLIYATKSFERKIKDYLGNKILINVNVLDHQNVNVAVKTSIKNLKIVILGNLKGIKIKKEGI